MRNISREIDYLRLSVTDRCNLRCVYCVPPDGIISKGREEILTFEEILRLAHIFARLGIKKIRITGGEPLVRKGIINLVRSLAGIGGVEDVSLTTNGVLLPFYAGELKKAGLGRINISLDTLKEGTFRKITRNNSFCKVLEGIDKAKEAGFYPVKLNMVVMKGINDNEIIDFADFSLSKGLILRFIEFMKVTPLWNQDYFIPIEKIKKICESRFNLGKIEDSGPGPALYYRSDKGGIIGFIKTDANNCRICSRLRLTSTGEMRICLYEKEGLFLKEFLRKGFDNEEIEDIIKIRLGLKEDIDYKDGEVSQLYMCKIGG